MKSQTIPVVSLKDFIAGGAPRDRFTKTVGDALADIGFFAVSDHGVDTSLIEKSYKVAEEFFKLPDAEKKKFEDLALKGQRGFTSFGREHAKDAKAPDLKEFWHVGQEFNPGHPLEKLYAGNLWPAQMPVFKETFIKLFNQLETCALHLLDACALYVNEEQDRFSKIAKSGNSILRVIHYPPIEENADPASIRAAPHEDINLITLLCEATTGGLELLERNGSWRPIHALKGQIIVDAGDMLQNISNGFFKSTTHRVVNPDNSRERRFSMPFFVHPRPEASLNPLPGCVARTGGVVTYKNISADDYLMQRLKEIGLT